MLFRSFRIVLIWFIATGINVCFAPTTVRAQEVATDEGAEIAAEAQPSEASGQNEVAEEKTDASTDTAEGEGTETQAAEASEGAAAEPKAASETGPATAAFESVFGEWKALLKSIRDIKAEYLIAEEGKLESLQTQFKEQIAEGKTMEPKLKEAAINAYIESPNTDREIVKFLITIASDLVKSDDYPAAKKLTQIMIDGNSQEKELSDLVGISAFGTEDFENAEKYLNAAVEAGTISQQGSQFMSQLAVAKETWPKEAELRAAEAKADDLPRVKLTTDQGEIVLELFENEAPETVGNFVSLVEKGFYDGLVFHRVMDAFMAQGGCPEGTGSGGPGYNIYCECVNDNHRNHFVGSLSMANSGPRNTGGSQFFLTYVPTTFLNGKHTVFGRVIEGMDVLPKIVKRTPDSAPPTPEPTVIIKAEVVRKRDHEYRPNKVK